MKKIIILLFIMIILSSCSVQEKMNSEMFIERLSKKDIQIEIKTSEIIYEDGKSYYYFISENNAKFLIVMYNDENKNINKISLTCNDINAEKDFMLYAKYIIDTFSFDDSSESVVKEIFKDAKINSGFSYYETQWYYYTSALSDNSMFFSIENKKLSQRKNTELTLKPNDIDITKGSE